ncbi:MAG: molybdate ABC transporter permease subunit [Phycisphaerales bacterium]|nr:molybdate ABC transporter permease subunit [Phycisphaerales bacterium]
MRCHTPWIIFAACVWLLVALMGCTHGSGDGEPTLRVAVASSVKTAAEEISLEFSRKNPGVRVEIAAGASGSLGVKIREGAPFDVFLAADEDTPQRLVQAGALDRESVRVYARGRLALWTRAESPQAAIDDPLMAIRDPRVRNIAIASPRLAPYGRAAESFLEQAGLFDAIGTKVAIADNAEQAAQFALTGAADLAFIPRSLVLNLGGRSTTMLIRRSCTRAESSHTARGLNSPWNSSRSCIRPKARPSWIDTGWGRSNRVEWGAIWLSAKLAGVTTLFLLVLGIPLAWWLASTRSRLRFVVETLVALPLVLPPTVLGFYLLAALGPRSPIGRLLDDSVGLRLAFSFWGLVIGSIVYSLPFAVQPITAAFAGVDRRLIEASWSLGQSRLRTFARVVVPLSLTGIVAGAVISFAHTMGEFGVVLMIGGNIPGVTRTASIAIFEDVQAFDFTSAAWTSGVLLIISFGALGATYALRARASPR